MTILEKKSNRKKISILSLVKKGEYSVAYALMLVEELSDAGKLTDSDYDELATYLEELLNEENTESISGENNEQLDAEVNSTEQIEEDGSKIEPTESEVE